MLKLLVLADDLTGANDVGVQIARLGIAVYVTIERKPSFAKLFRTYPVVVVDTESRHVRPATAARRVRMLACGARRAGARYFYKKTDSTLRGNVGSELQALMNATGARQLMFVPALPQLGRITRDGVQYVHGRKLHRSAFGRDPLNPMTESNVLRILAPQTSCALRSLRLPEAVPETLEGIYVFDAESENEMRSLARRLAAPGGTSRVFAGTAVFGGYLAERLPLPRRAARPPRVVGPVLIVNGSLNPVSLEQVRRARRPGALRLKVSPEFLLQPPGKLGAGGETLVRAAAAALQAGTSVLLYTVESRAEARKFLASPGARNFSHVTLHRQVARHLAALTAGVWQRSRVRLVAVFGGDTLMAVAQQARWQGFIPCREFSTGLSVSRVGQTLVLVSKSGGFGPPGLLIQFLKRVGQ